MNNKDARRRIIRKIGLMFGLLCVVLVGVGAMMHEHLHTFRELRSYARENREEMNLAPHRTTDAGAFRVQYEIEGGMVPMRTMHSWILRLHDSDGKPVRGARIAVDGGMPEHGHGLPTKPRLAVDFGDGTYRIDGMKFQMPGWWIVSFSIEANSVSDQVTFNLML